MGKDIENSIDLTLTPFHFEEIIKKGYSLDHIFLLKVIQQDWVMETGSAKIDALSQTLTRKGLVSDGKVTLEGKALLEFLEKDEGVKLVKKKSTTGPIDAFWKVFPSTDTFDYKGRKFAGSRALKTDKENCRIKLEALINEGEYTLDQIIKAVGYDVMQKKEQSLKTGQNKLTYIQNSLTYLRQRSFEPFIELIKEGKEIKETQNTNFDGVNI
jgi:hypothetical protein